MPLKPEEKLIGKTFEKCRILAKLGTGGMGSVYLAEHFGLGRKVAVKILPADMSRDPEYVARFMREATTAGRMEHPNIVQIHDVGYAEGRHFIVMQYVDGESLSTVVDELGAMEPRDAAQLAVGILRGLQHAHEQGIIHRDIKPDNVLITKGNEPKLLDFGLAIETEASLHITRDGMVVGTPYYLSPEQARGQKATPVCDVYATGITLYYLVTGKRPYVGATALAVLNKHIHEQAIPPMQHNSVVPKTLNDIILKMMAKKPEDRYATAGAAADALEAFLAGKAVVAKIPFRIPKSLDEFRQLPKNAQIGAGVGAAAILILLLILILPSGRKTETIGRPAAAPVVVESPDSHQLAEAIEYELGKKTDMTAWSSVLEKYEAVVRAVTSAEVKKKAEAEHARFARQVETAGDAELSKLKNDPDPVARAKELTRFPKPLLTITSAGARVQAEIAQIPALIEKKFDDDDSAIMKLLEAGRFNEARTKLAALKAWAPETRRARASKIEADIPRLERDFSDPLAQAYAKVHDGFGRLLAKRAVKDAYESLTRWLRLSRDTSENERLRVAGLNYDRLFAITPESNFPVELLNDARFTLGDVLQKGDDRVAYRILSDMLDALDLAFLISRVGVGARLLDVSKKEITFPGLAGTGNVRLGQSGYVFIPRGGSEKPLAVASLRPVDFLILAAAADGESPETLARTNGPFARAAGATWLYSEEPARLIEAARWFGTATAQRAPLLPSRVEKLAETGRAQGRDRLARAQADGRSGKFEAARREIRELERLWSFDPEMKADLARGAAALLAAELPRAADGRDYLTAKVLARELRAGYPGLYDEAAALKIYVHVMRQSGFWEFVSTDVAKGESWTWEAKATGAPPPVRDEGALSGIRFPSGVAILGLAPARTRGKSGLSVELRVNDPKRPFSAGIRFDALESESRYKLFAVEHPGRVVLYQVERGTRTELKSAPLEPKLLPTAWLDLSFMSEGGDLLCTVNQKAVFLLPISVPNDRGMSLASDADVNFKEINLRR